MRATTGTANTYDCTVAIVPRERFSGARRSLDSVLAAVPAGTPLVYVDAGSPPQIAASLARRVRAAGGTYLRIERLLCPNASRNIAMGKVRTPYVLFLDNDVRVRPGLVEALVDCARATGADVVGPLCLYGPIADGSIHLAGGEAHVKDESGRRRLVEKARFAGARLRDVADRLAREETQLAEFHGVFVRADVFTSIGPLDEGLLSFGEHVDFCLRVRGAGGSVWFEPRAVMTYRAPPPVESYDLPFFSLRWSDGWNRRSAERLRARWDLDPEDPFLSHNVSFCARHRRAWLKALPVPGVPGRDRRRRVRALIEGVVSPWLLHAAARRDGGRVRPFEMADPVPAVVEPAARALPKAAKCEERT